LRTLGHRNVLNRMTAVPSSVPCRPTQKLGLDGMVTARP
jgi:hypothetical protein